MSMPLAPLSYGELLDKISILELKQEYIKDPLKLFNVTAEHQALSTLWLEEWDKLGLSETACVSLIALRNHLKSVNRTLWVIEDKLRELERQDVPAQLDIMLFEMDWSIMDNKAAIQFVRLARKVYEVNDIRSSIKKEINILLGSTLVEEKSYNEAK